MFNRTRSIFSAAVAALLLSGIATATAASDHPRKKVTHASKPVPKSTAKPTAPDPSPTQRPTM
jgi:hypothetical protein